MFWPNKFCLPGGIISSNEKTIEDQIILRCKGLGLSDKNLLEVLFKGVKLVKTNRGVELAVIYNILLGNNPIRNQYSFVDISDINKMDDIIREHKAIINSVYHGINLL